MVQFKWNNDNYSKENRGLEQEDTEKSNTIADLGWPELKLAEFTPSEHFSSEGNIFYVKI